MRSDFNKLMCERERPHSSDCFGNYRQLKKFNDDYDYEVGGREGMKFRYGYDSKSFNENLNPLYGFVRGNVGRKWDKIYSEICSTFDKRSVINQHILIHLFQYVEINIYVIEGKLKYLATYGKGYSDIKDGHFDYYVDPRTGKLCFNKNKRPWRQVARERAEAAQVELAKTLRKIDENTSLEKIEDVWYKIEEKKYFVKERYLDKVDGVVVEKTRNVPRVDIHKKQLNKKEIKLYGLNK